MKKLASIKNTEPKVEIRLMPPTQVMDSEVLSFEYFISTYVIG